MHSYLDVLLPKLHNIGGRTSSCGRQGSCQAFCRKSCRTCAGAPSSTTAQEPRPLSCDIEGCGHAARDAGFAAAHSTLCLQADWNMSRVPCAGAPSATIAPLQEPLPLYMEYRGLDLPAAPCDFTGGCPPSLNASRLGLRVIAHPSACWVAGSLQVLALARLVAPPRPRPTKPCQLQARCVLGSWAACMRAQCVGNWLACMLQGSCCGQ